MRSARCQAGRTRSSIEGATARDVIRPLHRRAREVMATSVVRFVDHEPVRSAGRGCARRGHVRQVLEEHTAVCGAALGQVDDDTAQHGVVGAMALM